MIEAAVKSMDIGLEVISPKGNMNETQKKMEEINVNVKRIQRRIKQIDIKEIVEGLAPDDIKTVLKSEVKVSNKMWLECQQLLEDLDKIEKFAEHRERRKNLTDRIQAAEDMAEAVIQKIERFNSNGGSFPTENALPDENEGMMEQESYEMSDEMHEFPKSDGEYESQEYMDQDLNDDDEPADKDDLRSDGDDEREKSNNNIEQDLVDDVKNDNKLLPVVQCITKKCRVLLNKHSIIPKMKTRKCHVLVNRHSIIPKMKTRKCHVLVNKKWIIPDMKEILLELKTKNVKKEMEATEKNYNNCEVRDVAKVVIKIDEDTGEDENSGEMAKIKCCACNKSFSNASSLLVHSEKHMSGKNSTWFCCHKFCNYTGNRTDTLKHIRTKHTNEKLFKCEFCDKVFATCKSLKSHKKGVH